MYIGLEDFDEPSRWLRQLMLPSGTAVNPSEDIFSRVVCAFRNCKQKVHVFFVLIFLMLYVFCEVVLLIITIWWHMITVP